MRIKQEPICRNSNINIITVAFLLLCSTLACSCQEKTYISIERLSLYINSGNKKGLSLLCDSINEFASIVPGFSVDELSDFSRSTYLKGKRDAGIGYAFAATEIFNSSAESYYNLGILLSWTGMEKDAIIQFNKALSLDPGHSKTQYQLSRLNGMEYDREHEISYSAIDSLPGEYKPYAGKLSPGNEPVLFAPGIISTAEALEFGCTFSPDGKELYFTRRNKGSYRNVILVSYLNSKGWSIPDTAWFSTGYSDFEPHYSVLGDRIYFGSIRPSNKGGRPLSGIWFVEKMDQGWSEAQFLSTGMYCSMSSDSIMYTGNISGEPDEGISSFNPYMSNKKVRYESELNRPIPGQHPYISPDGSYILFDSYRDDYCGGESDIYVAFRTSPGTFSDALSLKCKVNGPGADFGASISPDGKYIFFTRHRDIYRVSTDILKKLLYEQKSTEEKNNYK